MGLFGEKAWNESVNDTSFIVTLIVAIIVIISIYMFARL